MAAVAVRTVDPSTGKRSVCHASAYYGRPRRFSVAAGPASNPIQGGATMRRSLSLLRWPIVRISISLVLALSAMSLGVLSPAPATPAQAAAITYTANLTGPAESPPNTSPAFGFTHVDLDLTAHTLVV